MLFFLSQTRQVDDELLKKIQDCQSRRLEDQRTPLPLNPQEESFLNLVSSIQGSRLDGQRASLHLTDPSTSSPSPACESVSRKSGHLDDEEFLDLLYRCQVHYTRSKIICMLAYEAHCFGKRKCNIPCMSSCYYPILSPP